jgi:hypothetical protein
LRWGQDITGSTGANTIGEYTASGAKVNASLISGLMIQLALQ